MPVGFACSRHLEAIVASLARRWNGSCQPTDRAGRRLATPA
jgi:hypothetical protein